MLERKTSPALTPVREHCHIQLKAALAAMRGSMPVLLFLIFTKEQRGLSVFYLFLPFFLKEFTLDTVWLKACLNERHHWPRASAHWVGNVDARHPRHPPQSAATWLWTRMEFIVPTPGSTRVDALHYGVNEHGSATCTGGQGPCCTHSNANSRHPSASHLAKKGKGEQRGSCMHTLGTWVHTWPWRTVSS